MYLLVVINLFIASNFLYKIINFYIFQTAAHAGRLVSGTFNTSHRLPLYFHF